MAASAIGEGQRYTKVAILLHWAIAFFIIYNLISGLLIWDIAKDWFKAHRPFYGIGLTTHMSAGFTVLVLTVIRIVWRLMHEPPPHPEGMKAWEKHASHFAHFLLYLGMVLMPLSGWAILSAHPPAGTEGAKIAAAKMAARSPMAAPQPGPGGKPGSPAGMPPPPGIWFLIPMPSITPIANIGIEAGGVKAQDILHDEFAEWHEIGGYLMILLLLLHIGGAIKHQYIDKEAEFERMSLRRPKS